METKKLKTKIEFEFDTSDITDIDKEMTYEVKFKEKKLVVIKEVTLPRSNRYKKPQDSSTKLF